MARWEAASPVAEGGKVVHPAVSRAPWVPAWLAQLVGAPRLPEDDRCDAFAMAVQRMRTGTPPERAVLLPGTDYVPGPEF